MHRQLYDQLRQMIHSGVLPSAARMPSSRTLSNRLAVSRFTIVTALDQLIAEGYLRSVSGSGTFVESNLTVPVSDTSNPGVDTAVSVDVSNVLSQHMKNLQWKDSAVLNKHSRFLNMSAPDHRLFPYHIWSKLTKEVFAELDTPLASYRDSDGPSLLEQQIAAQVAVSRGIRCDPEEVVTTLGAHHAVNLLTELLLDPADSVAIEEPGMAAIRSLFTSHGCKIVPMHVDEHGADPSSVSQSKVKLTFVTAAKQQPLTVSMPAKRKLELLNWAAENGSIIIEDDLGSEFRYQGRPIPPLKAMDKNNQVIYIGAFSMSLLQTLRIGFMIMPKELAAHCRRLIRVRYRATPQITEQILARFIQDGHYSRHLHKARRVYAKRQKALLGILQNDFSNYFEPVNFAAGFYNLCCYRDQEIDDNRILQRCNEEMLGVEQLSYYYPNGCSPKKALLIGFASNTEDEIASGMKILGNILKSGVSSN